MSPGKKKTTREKRVDQLRPAGERIKELANELAEADAQLLKEYLLKHVEEEMGPRVPGKVVKGQKTIWTYGDMVERFPIVSFVPDETIPLTWNGVKVQAYSGIEMHVPKPFYDIYRQHKSEQMKSAKSLPDLGFESIVQLGAGALPPQ